MKLIPTLQKGWNQHARSMIRTRPSQAQEKALADDKAMREAAELLKASRLVIAAMLKDKSEQCFGDYQAARNLLRRLEEA